jgi:tRNA nucleotidyltransferase (CCA-adding enzyme)
MGTVITTHKNMDLDALGAVIAAKKLYPEAVVVLPDIKGDDVLKLLSDVPELVDFVNESSFIPEDVDKVVIVDTGSASRIPSTVKELVREKEVEVVIYDHHSPETDFGNVDLHYKSTGSATSIMVLL